MNRRKKLPTARTATGLPNEAASERRQAAPEPNPPEPSRAFLAITTVLLAIWITFLLVLAVAS